VPRRIERPLSALSAGERIRVYRTRRGLSRERLAGLSGVSQTWIKQVERGTRQADSLKLLIAVAEVLRIQVWDLVPEPRRQAPDGTPVSEGISRIDRALLPIAFGRQNGADSYSNQPWRRERDSNPRWLLHHGCFQDGRCYTSDFPKRF
jgi:transcriptional regulator with XRE-family HTH domain